VRRLAAAAAALALAGAAGAATTPPVRASATLTPRAVLFGDTVTARVDAVVDPERADPRSLRLSGRFEPYELAGPVTTSLREADGIAYVRLDAPLRCLRTRCLAGATRHRLLLAPATLTYALRDGGSRSLALRWPALQRYSRLDPVEIARADPREVAPWRGDPAATPRLTYSVDPGLLHGLFLGGGIALLAAAALLTARLVPGWRFSLARSRALSPLEQALLVLETAWARGAAEQRKALELLAAELESAGEPPLAGQARELAWSRSAPAPATAETLAARVRAVIGGRSNGRAA
jgi:hypothetical protein